MNIFLRIFFTVIVATISLLSFITFLAIAASSHHIVKEHLGFKIIMSLLIGAIIITLIWLPWRKIANGKKRW